MAALHAPPAQPAPGPPALPCLDRTWCPSWPIDLAGTMAPLAHGRGDPTISIGSQEAWWATRGSSGPTTVHLARAGGRVDIRAWGPGAAEFLDRAPKVLGEGDDPDGFDAEAHPVMAAAHARFDSGLRTLRTGRVLESLVPAVLEQRVTGKEASRAWRTLVKRFGAPAPGAGSIPGCPAGLMVAPDASGWRGVPSWAWHGAGVDPRRSGTVMRLASRGTALERLAQRPADRATAALTSIPGVGGWTAAEVAVRAWGDRDAVSFGDYHLARTVVHALTGRRDGTDAQMAELLEPWAGQRARAVRLLVAHCGHLPRRGPRAAVTDHRGH